VITEVVPNSIAANHGLQHRLLGLSMADSV